LSSAITIRGRIAEVEAGYHPPVEEYLEAVHSLGEEGTPVIQARIAERLGRSAPSVSEMLDRLEDDGYLRRSGRLVELTDAGSALAQKVVRKHRLAERLLTDVIGLEWYKVHREAGRWEHVISDDVEEKLIALLKSPTTCPHGNPIPGSISVGDSEDQVILSEVTCGSTVRLERISEEVELNMEMLLFLDRCGLVPGAQGTVVSKTAGGAVCVETGGEIVELGCELARRLYVTRVDAVGART
jgi:DtxR family Mn-dependent transcriptional regulator